MAPKTRSTKTTKAKKTVVAADISLDSLRASLAAASRPYFVTGSVPADTAFSLLVPSTNGHTAVQFPITSYDALDPLIQACKQASFGRGNQEVLDPSYRRALVLHADKFGVVPSTIIDPYVLGIVDAVRQALFVSDADSGRIVAKLDKLNVYSTGDFFKGHVDTPKSTDMFGTLLINLPIQHEGGQLVVRAPNKGQMNAEGDANEGDSYSTEWGRNTEVSWIAFFSDCEHEVLPVTTGHRVTLSYNLFLEGAKTEDAPVSVDGLGGMSDLARRKLADEIGTRGVLSETRPRLCFHLEHGYPIDPSRSEASAAAAMLKGRDALIFHALKDAGVGVTFHYVVVPEDSYEKDNVPHFLPPDTVVSSDGCVEGGDAEFAAEEGGKTAKELSMTEVNSHGPQTNPMSFATYGNEPSSVTIYAAICIIATVEGKDVDDAWVRQSRCIRKTNPPLPKLWSCESLESIK